MPLTEGTFFWVMGVVFALLLAIFVEIFRLDRKLSPIANLAKGLDNWLRERGLDASFPSKGRKPKGSPGNPITAEKMRRREELVEKGKYSPLSENEAAELRAILEEEARDDLAKGVINFLIFLGVMAAIAALVSALTKPKQQSN